MITTKDYVLAAGFLLLLGYAISAIVAATKAPPRSDPPHVVETKVGDSTLRIDDFDRGATCWVVSGSGSTSVSCLPFDVLRRPAE